MIAFALAVAVLAAVVALERRTAAGLTRTRELAAAAKRTRPRWRPDRYTLHPLPPEARLRRAMQVAWLLWLLDRRRRADD